MTTAKLASGPLGPSVSHASRRRMLVRARLPRYDTMAARTEVMGSAFWARLGRFTSACGWGFQSGMGSGISDVAIMGRSCRVWQLAVAGIGRGAKHR